MGPLNRDHWYLYLIDFTEDRSFSQHPDVPVDQTLEVMMHDLDQGKMSQFTQDYFEKNGFDKKAAAQVTGITDIQPGTKIDDFLFEPCGYSMNGLLDNSYSTIHITPEPTCSFVSYETNVHLCDYSGVVERVLETFLPGRVTVTLFKDRREDVEGRDILKRSIPGYTRTTCTQYEFSPKYDLLMLQYDRVQQYDMVQ
jgi:S-adenosylmethionine decarboxylase